MDIRDIRETLARHGIVVLGSPEAVSAAERSRAYPTRIMLKYYPDPDAPGGIGWDVEVSGQRTYAIKEVLKREGYRWSGGYWYRSFEGPDPVEAFLRAAESALYVRLAESQIRA